MQNIGGENAGDAFYRYKMPKLIAKVGIGRGSSSHHCCLQSHSDPCITPYRSRAAVMASRQTW